MRFGGRRKEKEALAGKYFPREIESLCDDFWQLE